jgi:hypothetical protein
MDMKANIIVRTMLLIVGILGIVGCENLTLNGSDGGSGGGGGSGVAGIVSKDVRLSVTGNFNQAEYNNYTSGSDTGSVTLLFRNNGTTDAGPFFIALDDSDAGDFGLTLDPDSTDPNPGASATIGIVPAGTDAACFIIPKNGLMMGTHTVNSVQVRENGASLALAKAVGRSFKVTPNGVINLSMSSAIVPVNGAWTYQNNVYTIRAGKAVLISGAASSSARSIVVEGDPSDHMTSIQLERVELSSTGCALKLNDNAKLTLDLMGGTVNKLRSLGNNRGGIETTNAKLIITGNGTLMVEGGKGGAGIGGGAWQKGGDVTIAGGTIYAMGGRNGSGAGIGGGGGEGSYDFDNTGGSITITGGTVYACGSSSDRSGGAGIGGGGAGNVQDDFTAIHNWSHGGNIKIEGGRVNALGGSGGAGIGGGSGGQGEDHNSGGTIIISGGIVSASMIGGGGKNNNLMRGGSGGDITISGGTVYVPYIGPGDDGWDGPFSTGGGHPIILSSRIYSNHGTVTGPENGIAGWGELGIAISTEAKSVNGWTITLIKSVVVTMNGRNSGNRDYNFNVPNGATLTIPAGTRLITNGKVTNNGRIIRELRGVISGTVYGTPPEYQTAGLGTP